MELYKRCQPTIKKYSYVNGKFDEDLLPEPCDCVSWRN